MSLKERTANNVHATFVEEAKAAVRLLLFAERAESEGLPQIASLFRAVAVGVAEGIHAKRHFALLKGNIEDTQSNLEQAFQSEVGAAVVEYLRMLREADEDGEESAASCFRRLEMLTRDTHGLTREH